MLNEKTIEKFENCIKNGTTIKATVFGTKREDNLGTDILLLDIDGVEGIIIRDEVDIREFKTSLVNFVGKNIFCKVLEIDRETGVIICSRKAYKAEERDSLLEKMENNGEYEVNAKITKLLDFGAYVDMEGVNAILRNQDWSKDFTSLKEALKVGDKVKVKFLKKTPNNIFVKAVEKYCRESQIDLSKISPNLIIKGKVRTVTPSRCYVQIFPGFDALAPTPDGMELEFGMEVLFKVNQVKEEEQRVRGKILKVFTTEVD